MDDTILDVNSEILDKPKFLWATPVLVSLSLDSVQGTIGAGSDFGQVVPPGPS